jgi:hypothetical protein
VLGILLFLGVVFIVAVVMVVNSVQPPVDAMNEFLAAVEHHNYDTAYDLMCRQEQGATPRAEFPSAIAPFANRLVGYSAFSFDPFGRERTVEYTISDTSGNDTTYRATVVREAGAWRVCDFFK